MRLVQWCHAGSGAGIGMERRADPPGVIHHVGAELVDTAIG